MRTTNRPTYRYSLRMLLMVASVAVCSATLIQCSSAPEAPSASHTDANIVAILADTLAVANPYDMALETMPDHGCQRLQSLKIGPLHRVFNDSNFVHLEAAEALGITPIQSESDILADTHPLVHIQSCREYYVDSLRHSYAYLVPEAADLLSDIGREFNRRMAERGGGNYRIKVTSVLRTPESVRRLRRVNRNATDVSAHQYGTTFDISYSHFICDSTGVNRTVDDMRDLLAEVLYEARDNGRCYVKHERKQACFHITTRPVNP